MGKIEYIEITNTNEVPMSSKGLVVFPETLYDVEEVVRELYGDAPATVYFMTQTYNRRNSRKKTVKEYWILYPDKGGKE